MSVQKLIVSKFGGTSMGDAKCMLRSAQVALQQKSKIIVVSATSGTTNDLIAISHAAKGPSWEICDELLSKLWQRHLQIAQELTLDPQKNLSKESRPFSTSSLAELFEELTSLVRGVHLLKDCSNKAMDMILSIGERLSSILFTRALELSIQQEHPSQPELIDVRNVLKTDDGYGKAKPLTEIIISNCKEIFSEIRNENKIYITQGFIGSTKEGHTTTLGRGGSDYSAAILAEGVRADILEIWTDVAGIATTDPRICSAAQVIPEITFREASELATFGAKVLHPSTLAPAIRQNIPVFVGSSFQPEAGGTWIRRECSHLPTMRAMALRSKQVLVTLTTPEMLNAHGFLFRIFDIFNQHQVSVDAITTSEISVALTVDEGTIQNKRLFSDLSKIAEVHVEEGVTLVSLIGNNIQQTPGLGNKIFEAITDINVRMICLGASRHNFCFLVEEKFGPECIRRLHKVFIESSSSSQLEKSFQKVSWKKDFYDLLSYRRSIRKFKKDLLPAPEVIERILHAGMEAPSGKNRQNWRFFVVSGKKRDEYLQYSQRSWMGIKDVLKERLKPSLYEFTERFFYTLGDAPLLVFVYSINSGDEKYLTSIGSVYMAVENINLSCVVEGLGCCTMGAPLEIKKEVDEFLGVSRLSEYQSGEMELLCGLAIGYPDHTPPRAARQLDGRITYIP